LQSTIETGGLSAGDPAMKIRRHLAVIAFLVAPLAATAPGLAATPLVLKTDQTQVMTMSAPPGTVVVGNPSIADITIEGSQVFLHGRAFGTTNLIIFDQKGNVTYDFEVTVQNGATNDVSVYKAGAVYSYVCMPNCEGTLHVGDAPGWFSGVMSQMGSKSGMATGQKASDGSTSTTTPPPAQ
jgi:hypothetical protein